MLGRILLFQNGVYEEKICKRHVKSRGKPAAALREKNCQVLCWTDEMLPSKQDDGAFFFPNRKENLGMDKSLLCRFGSCV
jgi:hypothetical protein